MDKREREKPKKALDHLARLKKMEARGKKKLSIGIFVSIFLLWSLYILMPYGTIIFWALFFGYTFYPPYRRLVKATGRERVSGLVMLLLIMLLFIVPTFFLIGSLATQANMVLAALEDVDIVSMETTIYDFTGYMPSLGESIAVLESDVVAKLFASVPNYVGAFSGTLINFIILFFIIYYVFVDGAKMYHGVKDLIPLEEIDVVFEDTKIIINALIYGQILISMLQGLIGGAVFLFFGVSAPVFWGFVMGVFSFIPFLGPFMIWFPAGVIKILAGDYFAGIGILLMGNVISNVDTVLRPRIVGDKANLHPLIIILGIFGGLHTYGLVGIFIGPIIVSLLFAFLEPYRKYYLEARETEE